MTTAQTVLVAATAALCFASGTAFVTRAAKVIDPIVDYGVPRAAIGWLGAAKLAGALGLVAGIWLPELGLVAASALGLYFVGATFTVLRAKAFKDLPGPVVFLGLAVASALFLR